MAKLEKAIASNLTAARGREQSVTFEPAPYDSSDKRGRSPSGDASKNRKAKVASGNECDYPTCRHRSPHSRPGCRLARAHERDGIVVTKKPWGGARRLPQAGSGSRHTRITKPAVETIARSASVAVASAVRPSSKRRDKCGQTKSSTPLASTHAKQVHADNQSNTVTDLENKQQVPSILAVPRGVGPAVETANRVEKSSQRQNDTFSPSMVPQALYVVSAASRKLDEKIYHQVLLSCNANRETHFDAFHASATSGYPRYPTALNSTSKRVRVNDS